MCMIFCIVKFRPFSFSQIAQSYAHLIYTNKRPIFCFKHISSHSLLDRSLKLKILNMLILKTGSLTAGPFVSPCKTVGLTQVKQFLTF